MKRPFAMTEAEREALPIGPDTKEQIPLTAGDYARGERGAYKLKITRRKTRASYYEPDDPIAWVDRKGDSWRFGQFDDGSWFKQPFPW